MDVDVYIGNLPPRTTEEDIEELFSQAGEVRKVSLIKDRETGYSRGFAFVEMSTQVEAETAIKMLNGSMLGDRQLKANLARPKPKKGRGRRGGGYDRY